MNGFSLSRDHKSEIIRSQDSNECIPKFHPAVHQEQLETHTTARLPNYNPTNTKDDIWMKTGACALIFGLIRPQEIS